MTADDPHRELRQELLERACRDHRARAHNDPQLARIEADNTTRLAEIIDQHGWPGTHLVGIVGEAAAWLIAQAAPPRYLHDWIPLLRDAALHGRTSWAHVTDLIDRLRLAQGKHDLSRPQPIQVHDWRRTGPADTCLRGSELHIHAPGTNGHHPPETHSTEQN